MKFDIEKIVEEWSYRVDNGMPDAKNPLHVVELKNLLYEKKYPGEFIGALLSKLREDDIVKNKESGNVYVVQKHNPDTQKLMKKDASDADIEKIKSGENEKDHTISLDSDQQSKLKARFEDKDIDDYPNTKSGDMMRLRHTTAKMLLISTGDPDVELNDSEINFINNNLAISPRQQSGRYYLIQVPGVIRNSQTLSKDLGAGHMSAKHDLLSNMEVIQKKYPKLQLKYKIGSIFRPLSSDQLKNMVGHKAAAFKPQDKGGFNLESISKQVVSNVLSKQVQQAMKSSGYNPDEVEIYNDRIDPDKPETGVKALSHITNSLSKGLDDPNVSDSTKEYMKAYLGNISKVLKANISPEKKLKALSNKLGDNFVDAFESATGLSEAESKNFLKDFGEVATAMHLIAKGQEVYIPTGGSFPIADLVRVSRSGGDPIKIDRVSIKSKYGSAAEGAATSIKEVTKLISDGLPSDDPRKRTIKNMQKLQQNSSMKVDVGDDSDLPDGMKKSINSIHQINQVSSKEEAIQHMKDAGFPDNSIKTVMKKYEGYVDRWSDQKGWKQPVFENGAGILLQELAYRDYSGREALKTLHQFEEEYPVTYVVTRVSKQKNFEIEERSRKPIKEMVVEDKGYPEHIGMEDGKLTSIRYGHGNWGARPAH